MTPERRKQINRVFQGAIDGPADIAEYLDRECAGDADLRAQVESLLKSHVDSGDFMEKLVIPAGLGDGSSQETAKKDGQRIGPYRVIREIGRGGMGSVCLAERSDGQYEKTVAIKLVAPGMDLSTVLARFRIERQILANLEHPNIARLLDGGVTEDSRPYIVMEYIDGVPIDDYCSRNELSIDDRLKLFVVVCGAVQYAHDNNVIHRDIKPGNVLVTAAGIPKLLDFGIGKATGPDALTSATQFTAFRPMTPAFASPEQISGAPVTASSDTYSLGVLLYILLTGLHPSQPGSTTGWSRTLGSDLESIVSMCLKKEPAERYPTVAALAEDIRRHLASRPITARPQTVIYRGTRFIQRNRLRLKIATVSLLASLVLAAGLLSFRTNDTAVGPKLRSIAVLPFKTLASDEASEFLKLPMANELITKLGHFKQITVKPTSAIEKYTKPNQDPRAAGRELQVDSVLESTIQKSEDRIHVTAQLVDVQTGAQLWADKFDEKFTDIFELQDSIATRIREKLELEVTETEKKRVYRRYTNNAAAYEAYLQGRSRLLQNNAPQTSAAIEFFETALKLEPDYPLAYAGLARASANMYLRFSKPEAKTSWEQKAHQYAELALKGAPDLAEAYEARAEVYGQTEFDWDKTLEYSRLALELNPNLDTPHYLRSRSFYHLGLMDLADKESLLGQKVSAENRMQRLRVQGNTALFDSRFADALAKLEQGQELGDTTIQWQLAMAHYYSKETQFAEGLLEKGQGGNVRTVRGPLSVTQQRAAATLASFLAARGEKAKAKEGLSLVIGAGQKDHHVAYSIGATYAQLQMPVEAVKWLRKAKEGGFPCYPWYNKDPLLTPLRGYTEFRDLLTELAREMEQARGRYAR